MLADRLDGKVPQPVEGSDLGPQRVHISWRTHQHRNGALAAAAINQEVIEGETKDPVQDRREAILCAEVAPLRQRE